jgi:hypothetical protein
MAPEHQSCNLGYAATTGNAMAAKIKRVRNKHHGVKKPPSRLAQLYAWKKRILAEREGK